MVRRLSSGGASADHEAVLRLDTQPTRHPAAMFSGWKGRCQTGKEKAIAAKILDPNLETRIDYRDSHWKHNFMIHKSERERERVYIYNIL